MKEERSIGEISGLVASRRVGASRITKIFLGGVS